MGLHAAIAFAATLVLLLDPASAGRGNEGSASTSTSTPPAAGGMSSTTKVLIAVLVVAIVLAVVCAVVFVLWRAGLLDGLLHQFRNGPRSATVRYSALMGDNDWLEDDNDDLAIGGDVVSGAAPVVVVHEAPHSSNSSSAPAPAEPSAGAKAQDPEVVPGAPGAWEIKWDEDLEDDGGIGAWGELPVGTQKQPEQPEQQEKQEQKEQPKASSNPFDDEI